MTGAIMLAGFLAGCIVGWMMFVWQLVKWVKSRRATPALPCDTQDETTLTPFLYEPGGRPNQCDATFPVGPDELWIDDHFCKLDKGHKGAHVCGHWGSGCGGCDFQWHNDKLVEMRSMYGVPDGVSDFEMVKMVYGVQQRMLDTMQDILRHERQAVVSRSLTNDNASQSNLRCRDAMISFINNMGRP